MTSKLSDADAAIAVIAEVAGKRREHDAIMRTMGENLVTFFAMLLAFACIATNRYAAAVGAILFITTDSIFTNVLRSRMTDLNREILDHVTQVYVSVQRQLPPTIEGEEWRRDAP